jgi:hypothetical protein
MLHEQPAKFRQIEEEKSIIGSTLHLASIPRRKKHTKKQTQKNILSNPSSFHLVQIILLCQHCIPFPFPFFQQRYHNIMHHRPDVRVGISRTNSQVSALSTPSCLVSSFQEERPNSNNHHCQDSDDECSVQVFTSEVVCEQQLKDSPCSSGSPPKKPHRKSVARIRCTGTSQRKTRTSGRKSGKKSSLSTAQKAVTKHLVSSVSFSDDKHQDFDCSSTVSSLGMGFLHESSDVEDLQDAIAAVDHPSITSNVIDDNLLHPNGCTWEDSEDDDSILRIRSQIKMIRKGSSERFQASGHSSGPKMPRKSDSIPTLPSSPRGTERDDDNDDDDGGDGDGDLSSTYLNKSAPFAPSPTSVVMNLSNDDDDELTPTPPRHVPRRSSLPSDLSTLLESPMMMTEHSASTLASSALLKALSPHSNSSNKSNSSRSRIVRTDRWSCTACSETMLRDTELVKQSFERASSLRKEQEEEHEYTAESSSSTSSSSSLSRHSNFVSNNNNNSSNNNSPPTMPQRK